MSPPRITKAFVTRNVDAFTTKVGRARDLYKKIVLHGYSGTSAATAAKLINPDTRDAAEFIFFEIAAKFEDFVKVMFQAEVRLSLAIALAQSPFLMGDSDNGLDSRLERGSPQKLKGRGIDLLGMDSFFGSLDTKLGADTYNQLIAAHIVRDRIAHGGGQAQAKFLKLTRRGRYRRRTAQGHERRSFFAGLSIGNNNCKSQFFRLSKCLHFVRCQCKGRIAVKESPETILEARFGYSDLPPLVLLMSQAQGDNGYNEGVNHD